MAPKSVLIEAKNKGKGVTAKSSPEVLVLGFTSPKFFHEDDVSPPRQAKEPDQSLSQEFISMHHDFETIFQTIGEIHNTTKDLVAFTHHSIHATRKDLSTTLAAKPKSSSIAFEEITYHNEPPQQTFSSLTIKSPSKVS